MIQHEGRGMKSKRTFSIGMVAAFIIVGLIYVVFVNNDPVTVSRNLLQGGKYTSLVHFYNTKAISDDKKAEIEDLISNQIDKTYSQWSEYNIPYDDAREVLEPFSDISNAIIKKTIDDDLSVMEIENTGAESLAKAETYFADEDYLATMECRKDVDESYSSYKALNDLYVESKKRLMNQVGTPETEEEYNAAIDLLTTWIDRTDDEDFRSAQKKLSADLTEYHEVKDILTDATDSFENEQYHDAFTTLEEGEEKYPNSNKIKYAVASYQYAYILEVYGQVGVLMEDKKYDEAIEYIKSAVENYDYEGFHDLLDKAKRKDSVLYSIGSTAKDAGEYVFKSTKKLVLGDFDEEDENTVLSLGGSVAASVAGVDAPLDIRDLAYDISHWGEGDYFAARLALDAVGVVPMIGAVKYLKHFDTALDAVDTFHDFENVTDDAHDIANTLDNAHDIGNAVDTGHDFANGIDTMHDVTNAMDTVNDVGNATDNAADASKEIDNIVDSVIQDVTKKADVVPELTDDFSDITKAADKIDDATDTVKTVAKKGGSYADVFEPGRGGEIEIHHTPANSTTELSLNDGPAIQMTKEDHEMTASWGSSLEAQEYRKEQKELVESGHFREAVQMDIDDIHDKFGHKYDDAISEMLEYVDQLEKEGRVVG